LITAGTAFAIALLVSFSGAWASYRVGWAQGQVALRNKRRAALDLPRIPGGIMALVPPTIGPCVECGANFRRHPAMTDKRCSRCISDAIDKAEEKDLAEAKAQGWRA
jgi:hypothetical protein